MLAFLTLALLTTLGEPFSASSRPSWSSLQQRLPSALAPEPLVIDSALQPAPIDEALLAGQVVLYRERNGWCPYSERVWLALEAKRVDFVTVLIDNMGARPRWYSGTTPQVRWPDGSTQGESLDILRRLDKEYPGAPALFPVTRSPPDAVGGMLMRFKSVMPRNTRPSSRAAFLFSSGGGPVPRASFEVSKGPVLCHVVSWRCSCARDGAGVYTRARV